MSMKFLSSKLKLKRLALKVENLGFRYFCPVCKSRTRHFDTYGRQNRLNAQCPVCRMLERHRMVWLFLQNQTDLFAGKPKKMLHIAPEKEFMRKFQKQKNLEYITGDLNRPDVTEKIDIENINHPDNSFDVILCSHVLEHVPDDIKAMREFRRVLKPDGWAMLLVPVTVEKTIEDPAITDPKEREKLFGQWDHLRQYGPDVLERFKTAGLKVKEYHPQDFLTPKQVLKSCIKDEPVFLCTKT